MLLGDGETCEIVGVDGVSVYNVDEETSESITDEVGTTVCEGNSTLDNLVALVKIFSSELNREVEASIERELSIEVRNTVEEITDSVEDTTLDTTVPVGFILDIDELSRDVSI
jgi:TATA-box binding protein (TBP) (component of TFIID and TFIIIB)